MQHCISLWSTNWQRSSLIANTCMTCMSSLDTFLTSTATSMCVYLHTVLQASVPCCACQYTPQTSLKVLPMCSRCQSHIINGRLVATSMQMGTYIVCVLLHIDFYRVNALQHPQTASTPTWMLTCCASWLTRPLGRVDWQG